MIRGLSKVNMIHRLLKRWHLSRQKIERPEEVIDYVILHELCHLKVKEHSHHYWDYVRRYMPNYQEKIEWLKISGNHLIQSILLPQIS